MSVGGTARRPPKRPGPGARRALLALWPATTVIAWAGYIASQGTDPELLPVLAVAAICMAPPAAWLIAAAHWTAEPALRTFAVAHAVAWALIAAERLIRGGADGLEEIVAVVAIPYVLGIMTFGLLPPLVPAVVCGLRLWRETGRGAKWREHLVTAGLAAYQWAASYVAWIIGHG